MDHKLDKDYLEQLILEKKLLGLNEKIIGSRWHRIYRISPFKRGKKKKL